MIYGLVQHVVISTLFAAVVASLVSIRKTGPAGFRYYLWLIAALKFAVPTGVFFTFGVWLYHLIPTHFVPPPVYQSSAHAVAMLTEAWPHVGRNIKWLPIALSGVWFLGTVFFLLIWIARSRSQWPASNQAPACLVEIVSALHRRMQIRRKVTVREVTYGCDLAVFGIFKSVILVPCLLSDTLSREELEAILAHELMHIRRWDNLTAVIVHVLTCIFWFDPALWWIETRLMVERELACDESVIDRGWSTDSYVAGILKACQFHLAELQAGACGFSSLSLQERMKRIVCYKPGTYNAGTRITLIALGAVLTLTPATFGLLSARPMYGQSPADVQQHEATCVFADKHYPEGAIIHQDGGHEQLCVMALGKPMWVRTSPAIRRRGKAVVEIPAPVQQTAFCTPKVSSSTSTCMCNEGGPFSPGSIVDSLHGRLSCAAGRWTDAGKRL